MYQQRKHHHCPNSTENQKLNTKIALIAVELAQEFVFLCSINHLLNVNDCIGFNELSNRVTEYSVKC